MKTRLFIKLITIIALCFSIVSTSEIHAQNGISAIDNTNEYSTIDLIYMDKDLSVFANLLTMSGLNTSLAFVDNDHTLFVPTNEAFADMSVEKFAELTNPNNRGMLAEFVGRYFVNDKVSSYQLKENDILDLDDQEVLKIYSDGNIVGIGGAKITNADIETKNGVVHILDDVVIVTTK